MADRLTSRQSDELTLRMVKMRAGGLIPSAIALRLGKSTQFVSTATNRVKRADETHSGEEATGAYWEGR